MQNNEISWRESVRDCIRISDTDIYYSRRSHSGSAAPNFRSPQETTQKALRVPQAPPCTGGPQEIPLGLHFPQTPSVF